MEERALIPAFHGKPFAVIKLPGAFHTFFSGTGVAQGERNYTDDPEMQRGADLLYAGWTKAKSVKAGKGYYIPVECMIPESVMVLDAYADICIEGNNFGDKEYAELAAAHKVHERCVKALEAAGYRMESRGYIYEWVKEES